MKNIKTKFFGFFNDITVACDPKWSLLSTIGNSRIASMAWLIPIIAQSVRNLEDYMVGYLNWYNVIWLYWSLIFITIAQLIYFWKCPRTIKKYGSNIEQFKIEYSSTNSDRYFDYLHLDMIRATYVNSHYFQIKMTRDFRNFFIPSTTRLPDYDREYVHGLISDDYEKALGIEDSVYRKQTAMYLFENNDIDTIVDNYMYFKDSISSPISLNLPDWNIIHNLSSHRPELFGLDGLKSSIPYVSQRVYGEKISWHMMALEWKYDIENISVKSYRLTVLIFYLLAAPYFLYAFIRNFIEMLVYTIRSVF